MLPVPTTNPTQSVRTRALTIPSTNTQSIAIKKRTPLRKKTSEPDAKRPARTSWLQQVLLPDNISRYVVRDMKAVTMLGWTEFVRWRRGNGDFASLSEVKHPARCLLQQFKHRGAPEVLIMGEWSEGERMAASKRGPHKSFTEHASFLR